MKLNKNSVSQLVAASLPNGTAERIEWDDDIGGFGLRLRAGGSANWIFQYRLGAKQRRFTIGSLSAVTPAKARERAGELHAQVRLGQDPAGTKIESRARAAETFDATVPKFLAFKQETAKPRYHVELSHHLLTQAKPLHRLQLAQIDRRTIATLITTLADTSGPTAANRARTTLSQFFTWCMKEGLLDGNPCLATNKANEGGERDRWLARDEMREVWQALPDDDYGTILRLLLLTALRRDEIGGLRRGEIDLDNATIKLQGERTKNGESFDVFLAPPALALLKTHLASIDEEREFIFGKGASGFNTWSDAKEQLDARLLDARKAAAGTKAKAAKVEPMPAWWLHDFRRSFSTIAHDELDILPHVVEACLNHVSGHKAGVAGVYNQAKYAKQKAAAWTMWAAFVVAAVEDRDAKVIPLRA
jgi:integrase